MNVFWFVFLFRTVHLHCPASFPTALVDTIFLVYWGLGPSLWSSGQSSWLQTQRTRVPFPALADFLRGSGSGTGSTQPREYN
jgi:hypothetical protein